MGLTIYGTAGTQKGIDLLLDIADAVLALPAQIAIVASGDKALERRLLALMAALPGRLASFIGFDETLAHYVEAGADAFVMPSRFEPSGLNQMYSLRYGTVPVVRKTGGLADTVQEYDPSTGEGTGFVFTGYHPAQFKAAIDRALALWPQRAQWRRLMRNGMRLDLSWKESARKYVEAYDLLRKM